MNLTNAKQEPSSPPPQQQEQKPEQEKEQQEIAGSNIQIKSESKQNPLLLLQQTCNSIGSDICQNNISTPNSCLLNNERESPKQRVALKRSPASSEDDLIMPAAKIHKDSKSTTVYNRPNSNLTPQQRSPTPEKNYFNYSTKLQQAKLFKQQQQQQQSNIDYNNNYIEYNNSKSPNKSPNMNHSNKISPIIAYPNQQNNMMRLISPNNDYMVSQIPQTQAKMTRVSSTLPQTNYKNTSYVNNDNYYNVRALAANNPQLTAFYDQLLTSMYHNNNKIDYTNTSASANAAAPYNSTKRHNLSPQMNSTKRTVISPPPSAQIINPHLTAGLPLNAICHNPYCTQCLLAANSTAHMNNVRMENECTVLGCTQCDKYIKSNPHSSINSSSQKSNGVHQCCWLVHNNTKCGKLFSTLDELRAHVTAHTLDKEFLMVAANQSSHDLQQQLHKQQHQQQKQQQQISLNNAKLINSSPKKANNLIDKQTELINHMNPSAFGHYPTYIQHLMSKNSANKPTAFKPNHSSNHANAQLSYLQSQQNALHNTNNNLLLSQKLPLNSTYSHKFLNSIPTIGNQNMPNLPAHSVPNSPTTENSIGYSYANHQYLNSTINPIYDIV